MKKLFVIICLFTVSIAFSQDSHNECVAVFLGEKMVVSEYSPRGVSKISKNATGNLSVNLVELGEGTAVKGKAVNYLVALKDKETETLTMASTKGSMTTNVNNLLAKSKVGDHIILLMLSDKYALPHHSIEIVD